VIGGTDAKAGAGYDEPSFRVNREEAQMYQSFGSDLARERMNDRMREAEHYRLTKETRGAQAAERRSTVRKIASTALYLVAWPIKH
jgi:hypothetical protein